MDMRNWCAIFVVLTVVVAGCAGQSSPSTSTAAGTTTTTPADATTTGGYPATTTATPAPFGIDANATWERVSTLCNVSRPPPQVSISKYELSDSSGELRGFKRYLGLERVRLVTPVGGGSSEPWGVRVNYLPNATGTEVEQVLAHEFGHVVQPDDLMDRLRANGASGRTTDARYAREAVREGAAVFVADEYTERHLDAPTQLETMQAGWSEWTPGTRYFWTPYRFGAEYVHDRADSCADLEAVYENPPATTEQVLHPEKLGESPAALSVNATGDDEWSPLERDTMGEMFVRTALGSELGLDRAGSAAAGWGNDSLVTYFDVSRKGYAWTIRWDDTDEAAEFERAVTAYLDARGERRDGVWRDGDRTFRYRRVAPETTVLFAGDESFVRNATASGTNATVEIST